MSLKSPLNFGKKWDLIVDFWIFPARIVHCVSYYFFFLEKEGTHGGRSGFSGLVLACNINIILHIGFASVGLSYWEICIWISQDQSGSIVLALSVYIIINSVFSYIGTSRLLYNDDCINKMSFICSTWPRKALSLVAFFTFIPGFVILNYQVAMWTIEPWY